MFAISSRVSHFVLVAAAAALFATGCDKKESEPAPATEPAPAEPAPANPGKSAHGAPNPHGANPHGAPGSQGAVAPSAASPAVAIKWEVPEGWKEMPPRPMRKATYQIEGKAGAAEVAIFYFGPGQGGGVDANISRWVGQFQGLEPDSAKRNEREVNGMKLHSVVVEKGTFASGMPGMPGAATPKENWGMHATIVQAKSGQYFFKLTGPADTVSEQAEAFTKMLDGIKEG